MARSQDVPFGRAWLCLCLALLLHVTDEALTGFLRIYNPFVTTLRQKIPWLPFPTFEFHVWLAGLLGTCAVLLLLTRVAYRGATWLRPLAYVFSAFMILNALGHTAGTIAGTRLFPPPVPHPMPGFYSSPFLMVASIYLLYQLRANRIFTPERHIVIANAFAGNLTKPTGAEVAAALADAQGLWDHLLAELADEYHLITREWGSYSTKAGWSLRLKAKQRTIVYLSPGCSCFEASFALGDRALKAARSAGLPRHVLSILDQAKCYAEGTGVRIMVNRKPDIQVIKKLVAAKLAN